MMHADTSVGLHAFMPDSLRQDGLATLRDRIAAIREQKDTTKRIEMLRELNESLPPNERLEFPTLITNAYVRTALDKIEAKMPR